MPRPRPGFAVLLFCGLSLSLATASGAEPPRVLNDFRPDPASVTRYGPAYRYPQAGWTVVHIEGAPYERGYQHGHLMADEIAAYVNTLARVRSARDPGAGWDGTRLLVNALFLRRYDPEYLEEMKGIADGAAAQGAKFEGRAIDLIDVAAVNSELETSCLDGALEATGTGLEGKVFADPVAPKPKPVQAEHCSAFVATGPATADGKIVFGHITMFSLYEVAHFNVWLDVKPQKGHRVVMQTFAGGIHSGMDYYMNDNGMLVAETTIGQTRFGTNAAPLASRIRKAVQYSDSIDDAVAILKASNNGLYSNEWLLGDTKTEEIAMFELGTHASKLWRSSKGEFPGGTAGFYWGCNNTKDLEVRLETVTALDGKPDNVVFHPSDRDRKWLELYDRDKGKIGANFGFEAFTTAPLAAYSSCDAKFTTSDMARELKTYALFGPPTGRSWLPTEGEKSRWSDVKPLVSNDWTVLTAEPPAPVSAGAVEAVDLASKTNRDRGDSGLDASILPPAWHGTITPKEDGDLWLAAAFADFEKIVAMENGFKAMEQNGKLTNSQQDRLDLALFQHRDRYRSAVRRLGKDLSLFAVAPDVRRSEWYDVAEGKGVLLLDELRNTLGAEPFAAMMDAFGRSHAGRSATTAEFREAAEKAYGKPLDKAFADGPKGQPDAWSVFGFGAEPSKTLIVYGTERDLQAQREAAQIFQDRIARRWNNVIVPILSDADVNDEALATHHLILIGRPTTNRIVARMATDLAVPFTAGSFRIGDDVYAHPGTAVAVAGPNSLSRGRFGVTVLAGLSAESTRRAAGQWLDRGATAAQAVLMRSDGGVRPMLLPTRSARTDVAGRKLSAP